MDAHRYETYVRTDCWQLRREAYIAVHGSVCEVCGTAIDGVDVHHLTYEHLGRELDDDLMSLCRGCHSAVHGLGPIEDFVAALLLRIKKGKNVLRFKKIAEQVLKSSEIETKTKKKRA
jgi:5-methylcytosine-specific restriction endonuclease McrA